MTPNTGGNFMWKVIKEDELYHHGIKGQKWGVRRFQNPDGSLTAAGRKRLYKDVRDYSLNVNRDRLSEEQKKRLSAAELKFDKALSNAGKASDDYENDVHERTVKRVGEKSIGTNEYFSVLLEEYSRDTESRRRLDKLNKENDRATKEYIDTGKDIANELLGKYAGKLLPDLYSRSNKITAGKRLAIQLLGFDFD